MHIVLELKTQKLKVLTDFIAGAIQFPVGSLILLNAATKNSICKVKVEKHRNRGYYRLLAACQQQGIYNAVVRPY